MREHLRDFALGAAIQFVSYCNLVVNIRSIAHARLGWAIATDVIASAVGYLIIRRVSQHESPWTMLGMMVGGGVASWVGIWLTSHWV